MVGLIGENGSGKSTFSTIVAGIQKQDEGQLYLNGKPYDPTDITDAISKGVAMVVQEQGTFNNISVAANIFAGREQQFTKAGLLDLKAMNTAAAEVLDKIGVEGIDPTQVVNFMPFEERKLLEVARAECAEPQLLIIDETTTALGREGRDVMYRLINKMRDGNRSVLFISHDIEELMDICDSIIVLRDGHYIGALNREEMTVGALRQMMVGREIADNFYRSDWNGRLTDGGHRKSGAAGTSIAAGGCSGRFREIVQDRGAVVQRRRGPAEHRPSGAVQNRIAAAFGWEYLFAWNAAQSADRCSIPVVSAVHAE